MSSEPMRVVRVVGHGPMNSSGQDCRREPGCGDKANIAPGLLFASGWHKTSEDSPGSVRQRHPNYDIAEAQVRRRQDA